MTAVDHGFELQKACATFNGMKTPEDCIQQILIIRALFQIDQLFRQQLEDLSRFDKEVFKDFVINIQTHRKLLLKNPGLIAVRQHRPDYRQHQALFYRFAVLLLQSDHVSFYG